MLKITKALIFCFAYIFLFVILSLSIKEVASDYFINYQLYFIHSNLAYLICSLLAFFYLKVSSGAKEFENINLSLSFLITSLAIGALIGFSAVLFKPVALMREHIFHYPMSDPSEFYFVKTPLEIVNLLVFMPFFEELLFRGYFFAVAGNNRGVIKTIFLVALSSILYGLYHIDQDLPAIIWLVVIGAIFCAVRIKYNSYLYSFFAHSAYNGMIISALIISTR